MNEKNQGISTLQVAVFSDIHGNRWALEAVLKDIKRRGIQDIKVLRDRRIFMI